VLKIWRHLAHVASPEIADKVLDEIESAAVRIVNEPRIGRLRGDILPDLQGGLRSMLVQPYTIFYRISYPAEIEEIDDIEIIRVLHERRDYRTILESNNT
jgi:plasmid stabilization system protein ParE